MSTETDNVTAEREWTAENISLICFPADCNYDLGKWWSELTGSEPEEFVRKQQRSVTTGTFNGFQLSLETDPFRAIWKVIPQPLDEPLDEPPSIGSLVETLEWFLPLMQGWLRKAPPIMRLAFAGSLQQRTGSANESIDLMRHLLPKLALEGDISDFQFRCNRPRDVSVGDRIIRINRLCTWSTVMYARLNVAMQPGNPSVTPVFSSNSGQFACQLEFDINTAMETSPTELKADLLPEIFERLTSIAVLASSEGDKPV